MPRGNGKMYNDKYNTPDNYTDMNGQTKTFTHINYSNKPKITFNMKDENSISNHLDDRKTLQQEILALPPSMFPPVFQDFIVRGADMDVMGWNEKMILDEGTPFNTLRNLKVLTENRFELHKLGLLHMNDLSFPRH